MGTRTPVLLLMFSLFLVPQILAQDPELSPDAPKDKPFFLQEPQWEEFLAAIEPYSQKAKETYPEARSRYLDGLPIGEVFFVTTRLVDPEGRMEQVFIRVTAIREGVIEGVIASDARFVEGYEYGEIYSFPETELVDWLIAKPDGSEEGNFVGKFLDEYQGEIKKSEPESSDAR